MSESTMLNAFGYLTQPEIAFLDAAVERLIPADELGPGARDAGVTCLHRPPVVQRMGHARPQLPLGALARRHAGAGLPVAPDAAGDLSHRHPRDQSTTAGPRTASLSTSSSRQQQDEVLQALEKDKIELPSLSSKLFFDLLWRNTEEGYFADPMYGGNRDKVGWKLIGFPGVASGAYREHVDNPEPYRAEPVSILDVQLGQAQVDAQGFAKHIMIKQGGGK